MQSDLRRAQGSSGEADRNPGSWYGIRKEAARGTEVTDLGNRDDYR